MDSNLRIDGDRIYIRPIEIKDTEEVLKHRNSEKVVKNFLYRKPITKEEHLQWLENKVKPGKVCQFVVCDRKNDEILGSVYTQDADSETGIGESGIFLGETNQLGKGIGTECYTLLIEYSFDILKLRELKARVLAQNIASQKLHEKLGYVQESYLKDGVFIDGKYEDLILYSKKNPKYE